MILALEETFYLLQFNANYVAETFANGQLTEEEQEDGLEDAFTFGDEYTETVVSGLWVSSDCFVWINSRGAINYLIGGRIMKLGNSGKK